MPLSLVNTRSTESCEWKIYSSIQIWEWGGEIENKDLEGWEGEPVPKWKRSCNLWKWQRIWEGFEVLFCFPFCTLLILLCARLPLLPYLTVEEVVFIRNAPFPILKYISNCTFGFAGHFCPSISLPFILQITSATLKI